MTLVTVRYCKSVQSDITLWYDTFGKSENPPLLLVMGMNAQATVWPSDFCEKLADIGFYVIRLENRDVGLSTHLDHLGTKSICCLACCASCVTPSYTLNDMAADTIAFMDKLNLTQGVHLFGQSMGGMICQIVASLVPERLASLTLLFSSPGAKSLPDPSLSTKLAMAALPKDNSREAFIANYIKMAEVCFFTKKVAQENLAWLRDFSGGLFDRSTYLGMITRHASAVVAQEDRSAICKNIKVPTLILHGDVDVLVLPAHGQELAKLIPCSKYVLIQGMGHGLVPCFYDDLCNPIAEITGLSSLESRQICIAKVVVKEEKKEGNEKLEE